MSKMNTHQLSIIDQFTRQAVPFSQVPGHTNEESLQLLIKMVEASTQDTILDVACGPGIVACAFALVANHVTGVDITPAMLIQAQLLAQKRGLTNLSWQEGEGEKLPFADNSFSIVLSRYAFHHCLKPEIVLSEMVRVCRHGGKILVADVVLPSEKVEAYDRLEKLRDRSHTHALSLEELQKMIADAKLTNIHLAYYKVEIELEQQLAASFPSPGDEEKIRQIIETDMKFDDLGINAHLKDHKIHYAIPITVIVGEKTV